MLLLVKGATCVTQALIMINSLILTGGIPVLSEYESCPSPWLQKKTTTLARETETQNATARFRKIEEIFCHKTLLWQHWRSCLTGTWYQYKWSWIPPYGLPAIHNEPASRKGALGLNTYDTAKARDVLTESLFAKIVNLGGVSCLPQLKQKLRTLLSL